MMRAMKGTRMAAATELLLEAKCRPMDSGSDSNSLRSAKCQSIPLKSQTHPEVIFPTGHSTLLQSGRYCHLLLLSWQKPVPRQQLPASQALRELPGGPCELASGHIVSRGLCLEHSYPWGLGLGRSHGR
jgi:hypothetical protein